MRDTLRAVKALVLMAASVVVLVALGALFVIQSAPTMPEPRRVDWAAHQAGPTDDVSVYWIGHSLMNHRDAVIDGSMHLMDMVAFLARSSSLAHAAFDHTHFGAPLSLNWRGRPHSFEFPVPEMRRRRQELETNGARYDAMVMTEGLPVVRSMKVEHSAYYAQRFYCALIAKNPEARVYLYESWNSYQAGDRGSDYGPHHRWDWRQRLVDDRPHWTRMADLAATGRVPAPGWTARLLRLWREQTDDGCEPRGPIFLVPVGTVLGVLYDRLTAPAADAPRLTTPSGDALRPRHLFQNPMLNWPKDWPLPPDQSDPPDSERIVANLPRMHAQIDVDDVHPSQLGVYVTALTHYAVLYRRSPVGLPPVEGVTPETARWLQALVWEVVRQDPRAGVAG